jgi:hypothetical protein
MWGETNSALDMYRLVFDVAWSCATAKRLPAIFYIPLWRRDLFIVFACPCLLLDVLVASGL